MRTDPLPWPREDALLLVIGNGFMILEEDAEYAVEASLAIWVIGPASDETGKPVDLLRVGVLILADRRILPMVSTE
jgi:hypothetical protein